LCVFGPDKLSGEDENLEQVGELSARLGLVFDPKAINDGSRAERQTQPWWLSTDRYQHQMLQRQLQRLDDGTGWRRR
jgi:hypothetical protein